MTLVIIGGIQNEDEIQRINYYFSKQLNVNIWEFINVLFINIIAISYKISCDENYKIGGQMLCSKNLGNCGIITISVSTNLRARNFRKLFHNYSLTTDKVYPRPTAHTNHPPTPPTTPTHGS